MKFISFKPKLAPAYAVSLGVLTDRGVLDLRLAAQSYFKDVPGDAIYLAKTLFADLETVIKLGDVALTAAQNVVRWASDKRGFYLNEGDVTLLAPLTNPSKFIGIGLNYQTHADESKMEVPKFPVFFSKYASAIVGPDAPVVLGQNTKKLDYEVELAVIIGRTMKNVAAENALDYVFGYTIVNDISARDLQLELGGQWVAGKACDSYAPLGPTVVTADSFGNPREATLKLWVNDELRQNAIVSSMLQPVDEILAYLSTLFTLEPGSLIATGTPPGVGLGFNPPRYLKAGDTMRAEISGIGVLGNPVISL